MDNEMYFYKIMVSPSTQTNKLKIPEKYVKENAERLLGNEYVKLRVGKEGRVWRIELFKANDQIWLTKGWERIVMNYSIKCGYFLLFKFNQLDSTFLLNIFDTTGFEIEYDHQQGVPISSSSEDTDTDYLDDDDDGIVLQDDDDEVIEPTDVKARLEAYITQLPHFTVIMKPSYVSKTFRYSIPIRHARRYLKRVGAEEIMLKVRNEEKRYRVRLNWYNKNSQATVGHGWKKFVVENNIKEGDGCVFELLTPLHIAYKVTIFRLPTLL